MDTNLHIYGQKYWHDNVVIIGTTEALEALRDAIDDALKGSGGKAEDIMVNDGEGYDIFVNRVDDERLWVTFANPYSDPDAQGTNQGKVYPD